MAVVTAALVAVALAVIVLVALVVAAVIVPVTVALAARFVSARGSHGTADLLSHSTNAEHEVRCIN